MEKIERVQLVMSRSDRDRLEKVAEYYEQSLSGVIRFAIRQLEEQIEQRQQATPESSVA